MTETPRGGQEEQPHERREVELGEYYPLFPLQEQLQLSPGFTPAGYYETEKQILLPDQRIVIHTIAQPDLTESPFVNFLDREHVGYYISDEDFDPADGPHKYSTWIRNQKPYQDPLNLSLGFSLHPEATVPEGPLRFQIRGGLGVMEGEFKLSDQEQTQPGAKLFVCTSFYPIDSGKPPYIPNGGLKVQLPDDPQRLTVIEGRMLQARHRNR